MMQLDDVVHSCRAEYDRYALEAPIECVDIRRPPTERRDGWTAALLSTTRAGRRFARRMKRSWPTTLLWRTVKTSRPASLVLQRRTSNCLRTCSPLFRVGWTQRRVA